VGHVVDRESVQIDYGTRAYVIKISKRCFHKYNLRFSLISPKTVTPAFRANQFCCVVEQSLCNTYGGEDRRIQGFGGYT
jgi:hypothetical protein